MLIFHRDTWPEHRPWALAAGLAALAAACWYGVEGARSGRWPGGGSLPGFVFGVTGGLIIVFEMLLWVRKKYRRVRIGRAKLWMKAHIWLGLLCLPLLVLHSGFRWWGSPLSGALIVLLLVVIASGVWGLALQQFLPTTMLKEVPAETIYSQIAYVREQLLEEVGQLVAVTCGRDSPQSSGVARQGAEPERSFLVIGAVRSVGSVQGKFLETKTQARRVPGSEPLLKFFDETVAPFLRARQPAGSPLASAARAVALFRTLKTQLDPAAHGAVDALEVVCEQRRQFDKQARLYGWLHGWLCVHLPFSVALFVLMIAHIYFALRYF